jgi:hypothetical protein
MTLADAFETLMEEFPFAEIQQRMNQVPRWKWGDRRESHVPSKEELKAEAIRLFHQTLRDNHLSLSCGGLTARKSGTQITLSFGRSRDVWATRTVNYSEETVCEEQKQND